jgi:hypothetical protein
MNHKEDTKGLFSVHRSRFASFTHPEFEGARVNHAMLRETLVVLRALGVSHAMSGVEAPQTTDWLNSNPRLISTLLGYASTR